MVLLLFHHLWRRLVVAVSLAIAFPATTGGGVGVAGATTTVPFTAITALALPVLLRLSMGGVPGAAALLLFLLLARTPGSVLVRAVGAVSVGA